MVKKLIAPSILSADFSRLKEELASVEAAGADYIHVDVMDGHFVPNITIGPFIVEAIKRSTKIPLDVHLMIERPEDHIKSFRSAGADIITVHAEATVHLHGLVQSVKELGAKAGVSINPGTPVEATEEVLDCVDLVLVMSVNPGFGGQRFIPASIGKIKRLRKMLDERGLKAILEVDGGIKVSNIKEVSKAGADMFVAGSAVFGSGDYKKTIEAMRKEMQG
ncbi:MAG TPA: ribulose-phosphate 3-epimerase [Thermodesulfobacteriota bacterium]|nr:ribulose-phosphate 3-epimerase [Thermodesulfobacteriota bacterium]